MRDLGEALLYIVTGYGWYKILEKPWNFLEHGKIYGHPGRVLFMQICLLLVMGFLGIVTAYYLVATRKER